MPERILHEPLNPSSLYSRKRRKLFLTENSSSNILDIESGRDCVVNKVNKLVDATIFILLLQHF